MSSAGRCAKDSMVLSVVKNLMERRMRESCLMMEGAIRGVKARACQSQVRWHCAGKRRLISYSSQSCVNLVFSVRYEDIWGNV
jgi:hypothetical protein